MDEIDEGNSADDMAALKSTSSSSSSSSSASEVVLRLCQLCSWPSYSGYGFDVRSDIQPLTQARPYKSSIQTRYGHFIAKVR